MLIYCDGFTSIYCLKSLYLTVAVQAESESQTSQTVLAKRCCSDVQAEVTRDFMVEKGVMLLIIVDSEGLCDLLNRHKYHITNVLLKFFFFVKYKTMTISVFVSY